MGSKPGHVSYQIQGSFEEVLRTLEQKLTLIVIRMLPDPKQPIAAILISQHCDSMIEVGLTIILTRKKRTTQLEAFGFAGGGGWPGCTQDWGRNTWIVNELAPYLEHQGFKLE